jgi:hypothetical protein
MKCGFTTLAGYSEIEVMPNLDQRKDAAKELCGYVYPKRKAVEHSGNIGGHEERLRALAEEDGE